MNTLLAFVILFAALFGLSFLTKRRFGVLGLALCAGALLSNSWAGTLTPWVESQGVQTVSPPLSTLVSVVLILLPPVLLLFSGPTYAKLLPRLAGSLAFALLAFTFLLAAVGSALVVDSVGFQFYRTINEASNAIIVVGIVAALADILLTRTPHHSKKSSH